jgi:Rieske Fe-S protein
MVGFFSAALPLLRLVGCELFLIPDEATMPPSADNSQKLDPNPPNRRTFLGVASTVAMTGGVLAGYGTFAGMAGRFLYPSQAQPLAWVFVCEVAKLPRGEVVRFKAPAGQTVSITRKDDKGDVTDFLALLSTCPHLGCQVHWEAQNNRFFCPCHNGAFDADGKAIAGPPKEAKQSLGQYPLQINDGLLFIQVPVERLA